MPLVSVVLSQNPLLILVYGSRSYRNQRSEILRVDREARLGIVHTDNLRDSYSDTHLSSVSFISSRFTGLGK